MNTHCFFLFLMTMLSLPASAITISYRYDAARRLTSVDYNGTSRTAFGYDKNGNLLSRTSTVTGATAPPALAAIYNGLFTNGTPAITNTGSLTLTLLASGSFTGRVTIEGVAYAISGTFDAAGNTTPKFINRAGTLTDLTLNLALDVDGGTQQITGQITDGVFTSTVVMDAVRYNTTTNLVPAGLAMKFTALFKQTQVAPTIPLGPGYATITINTAGTILLAGKLPNNIAISQTSTLVGLASWPMFIPLHVNKGCLAGTVNFSWKPGISDFEGSITWVKPFTTGTYYPAAFTTPLSLVGSRFDAAVAGQRVLNYRAVSPNAVLTATDGNLIASPLTKSFTLTSANAFTVPVDANAIKLTPTLTTGYFTGSFKDGAVTRLLYGVLFQESNTGGGFFTGTTLSGEVKIEGLP